MKAFRVCVVLYFAFVICVGRFFVPGHGLSLPGTYEAFAHLFVGGLIGAWVVGRQRWLLLVVGVMSAVEVVAFLLR